MTTESRPPIELPVTDIETRCRNIRTLIGVTLNELRTGKGLAEADVYDKQHEVAIGAERLPVHVHSFSSGEALVSLTGADGRTTFEVMNAGSVVNVHTYGAQGTPLGSHEVQNDFNGHAELESLHAAAFFFKEEALRR